MLEKISSPQKKAVMEKERTKKDKEKWKITIQGLEG
jgi:hypothetical protein